MARHRDELIDRLAAGQRGLVTREQLLRSGLGPDAVKYRVSCGRLRPLHRGIYQVGQLVAPHAREMAAVLACGPTAVVSHGTASGLRRWFPLPVEPSPVDVTVRLRHGRQRAGIRVHRDPGLTDDEVATVEGIPATAPGRTLLDLAGVVGPRELERAFARAERQGLTADEVQWLVERHPKRRGSRALRALLRQGALPSLTRSEAEERLLALVRRARLPAPELNVVLEGWEVDFLWRPQRLVVEVDGFAFHSSRSTFESDRRRDAQLSARGFRVVRVTWRQLSAEPEAVLARLAQTLAAVGTL